MSGAPPWLAEQEVSQQLAQTLISQQFPDLEPFELHHLGTGWDNIVYQLNQDYVFRFPRRSLALELMQTEWQLLDSLKHQLSLQIPQPCFDGQPSPDFNWPFAGYTLVRGQSACQLNLGPEQRLAMVPALAGFLKELHGLSPEWLTPLQLPPDRMQKVEISLRRPQSEERLQQALQKGLLNDIDPYLDWLTSLPETTPRERPKCLVHGDLYLRHLMINPQAELSGVIDWGDAHLGDRATDLSVVYAFLPPEARSVFWHIYGQVAPLTQDLAKLRALFHSLALLLYADDIDDQRLLDESKRSLGWLL